MKAMVYGLWSMVYGLWASGQDLPLNEFRFAWNAPGLSSVTNLAEWSGGYSLSPTGANANAARPAFQTNNAWVVGQTNGFRNAAAAAFETNRSRGAVVGLVKLLATNGGVTVFGAASTAVAAGWWMRVTNGNLQCSVTPISVTNGTAATVTGNVGSQALVSGRWHFVGATSDGTNLNLFVDGVQIGVVSNSPLDDSQPGGYAGGWLGQIGIAPATMEVDLGTRYEGGWFHNTAQAGIGFVGYQAGRRWTEADMGRWNSLLMPFRRGLP